MVINHALLQTTPNREHPSLVFACVGLTIKVNTTAVPVHTMKACRERRGTAQPQV
jgi:hypothetical protein